jgi:hypothetical protein
MLILKKILYTIRKPSYLGKMTLPELITYVNTIQTHADTRVILPRYEVSCMEYAPKWYKKTGIPQTYWYQKNAKFSL